MNLAESTVVSTRMKNVNAQYTMLSAYFSQQLNKKEMTDRDFDIMADDIAGMFMSRIQLIDRNFKIVTDSYEINKGKMCVSQDVNRCFNGTNSVYTDKQNQCIVMVQAIKDYSGENIIYVMFGTSSISDIYSAMDSIELIVIACIVIFVIIAIAYSLLSSYQLVKPFRNINETIEKIDQGHMTEEINLKGCTEVETISASFNKMLNRINRLETSRQEFVSNVSHELKTPLTSMKVLCDSLLMQEDVPAEMYREFMGDLSNEIDRENAIISDLLTLVKLDDDSAQPLNITSVNINNLVESTMKLVRPLAEKKNIEMIMETFRPIVAEVDEVRLSMALLNLIENAVKYNNVEGWVHVSLNADQTFFYITIEDNGFGIPKAAQEHIFDRFYRVDKARDRATGGTGLGLAITKRIVLSHNGIITVEGDEGIGTKFVVKIPLTHIKKA
ncbi:MAG: HAMP domain-containing histidine kinase [Lachnospiraceae bacterium]|nr:HAMP domain-containing histidine kinase [Lachnospiraceae bacterium]MBR6350370.1 HAMP domain-containing histidine kinase [Lachnospiraceae bacterium]